MRSTRDDPLDLAVAQHQAFAFDMIGDDRAGAPGALDEAEHDALRLVDAAIVIEQRAAQPWLVDRRFGRKCSRAVEQQRDALVAAEHVLAAERVEQHHGRAQGEPVRKTAGERHHAGQHADLVRRDPAPDRPLGERQAHLPEFGTAPDSGCRHAPYATSPRWWPRRNHPSRPARRKARAVPHRARSTRRRRRRRSRRGRSSVCEGCKVAFHTAGTISAARDARTRRLKSYRRRSALPLIRLPAPSPREGRGEVRRPQRRDQYCNVAIGENINEIKLLPVPHGEKVPAGG